MKKVKRFFAALLACVSITAFAVGFSACEETTNVGQNNSESSSGSNGSNSSNGSNNGDNSNDSGNGGTEQETEYTVTYIAVV